MKPGPVLAIIIAVLGLSAVVFAFVTNASPYVTVTEAKTMKGNNLHVAGELILGSVQTNPGARLVTFDMKDDNGDVMSVRYQGPPPNNLRSATRVVAVGKFEGGKLHSEKLLLKCPSKYESETAKS